MKTPVDVFEETTFEALSALNARDWQGALVHLTSLDRISQRFKFEDARFSIMVNQLLALEQLGREQALRELWQTLVARIGGGYVSTHELESARSQLLYFANRLGGDLENLEPWQHVLRTPSSAAERPMDRDIASRFNTMSFAQTHPAVVGLSLALLGNFPSDNDSIRRWLEPFNQVFGPEEESEGYLELIASLDSEPRDTVKVYRALCRILSEYRSSTPGVVFLSWLMALRMENEGLPKKLAFSPNPPEESRLTYSIQMVGHLARALNDQPGFGGALASFWCSIHDMAHRLRRLIELRHQRGGKKSADIELLAELTYWQSASDFYFCRESEGLDRLSETALLAARQALNATSTALKVLRLQGLLLEQAGRRKEALAAYKRGVELVCPKFDTDPYLQTFQSGALKISRNEPTGYELLTAFAGWVRLTSMDVEDSARRGFDLIESLADSLPYDSHCRAAAMICLALAYRGHVEASRRAEHWSRACGSTSLLSGALVYSILLDEDIFSESRRTQLMESFELVESLPQGEFRLTVQLLVAEGLLRSNIPMLRPRAEMLIRRAGLTRSHPQYRTVGDENLLWLPSDWQRSLNESINAAVKVDLSASLRPLLMVCDDATASRRQQSSIARDLSADIEGGVLQLTEEYATSGGVESESVSSLIKTLISSVEMKLHRLPKLARPRGREMFLESYRIGGRWIGLLIGSNGASILSEEMVIDQTSSMVAFVQCMEANLSRGSCLYVGEGLPRTLLGFEANIDRALEIDVVYGQRRNDGKCAWFSDTSILMIGDCWTSTDLQTLRSCLKDNLALRMCLGFEEQAELTPQEWSKHDVIMLGVTVDSRGVLSLWDEGTPINVEKLAFARGDCRAGICILVTSERAGVDYVATRLSEYFDAGVLVVSAGEVGLKTVAGLLNRTSLLNDLGDVIRYFGREYRSHADSGDHFAALYASGP